MNHAYDNGWDSGYFGHGVNTNPYVDPLWCVDWRAGWRAGVRARAKADAYAKHSEDWREACQMAIGR